MDPGQHCRLRQSVGCKKCCFGADGVFRPVPPELQSDFGPAALLLRQWRRYRLRCPAADRLRVGRRKLRPIAKGQFRLRIKNHVGLLQLQPLADGRPLTPPVWVEVLSQKFPTPEEHRRFFGELLDDLFCRAARLPFTFSAPTVAAASEALRPPTPLFNLHFLCQYSEAITNATAIVLAQPYRKLRDTEKFVRLAEAVECDADVLLGILQRPEQLVRTEALPLARRLGGYAPQRVWQRLAEDTFDTPENRFVRHFLSQLVAAAHELNNQPWWQNVPRQPRRSLAELSAGLRRALGHPVLAEAGPMRRFPAASHVLRRREGYRELLRMWHLFQLARRPLFGRLAEAIDLRDLPTLYEIWVFLVLVEEIAALVGQSPAIDLRLSDEHGLEWCSEAQFGSAGTLRYNFSFYPPQASYSVALRPDFAWLRDGQSVVALDAKFRMERLAPDENAQDEAPDDDDRRAEATAKHTDLYKMHTYRDALRVRAAVAVYPGDASVFYDCSGQRRSDVTLKQILFDGLSGIGAIARRPGRPSPETIIGPETT